MPFGNKVKKQIKPKRRGGAGAEADAPSRKGSSSHWSSAAPEKLSTWLRETRTAGRGRSPAQARLAR